MDFRLSKPEFLAHLLFVAIVVTAAWLAPQTGWDEAVSALYFSVDQHVFPLRNAWLVRDMIHNVGKQIPALLAVALLVMRVRGHFPASRWHGMRAETGYALAVLVLGTGIVGLLKDNAPIYCPWSLADFGGDKPHYTFAQWIAGAIPGDAPSGHCWPSGHAAGAFAMIGVYFAARVRRHSGAGPILFLLLAWGAICGWAQIARGAHFISHVLWSVAICWSVALALLPMLRIKSFRTSPAGHPAA